MSRTMCPKCQNIIDTEDDVCPKCGRIMTFYGGKKAVSTKKSKESPKSTNVELAFYIVAIIGFIIGIVMGAIINGPIGFGIAVSIWLSTSLLCFVLSLIKWHLENQEKMIKLLEDLKNK